MSCSLRIPPKYVEVSSPSWITWPFSNRFTCDFGKTGFDFRTGLLGAWSVTFSWRHDTGPLWAAPPPPPPPRRLFHTSPQSSFRGLLLLFLLLVLLSSSAARREEVEEDPRSNVSKVTAAPRGFQKFLAEFCRAPPPPAAARHNKSRRCWNGLTESAKRHNNFIVGPARRGPAGPAADLGLGSDRCHGAAAGAQVLLTHGADGMIMSAFCSDPWKAVQWFTLKGITRFIWTQ